MGRAVAPRVAARFGRLLLELGGNNAAIVAPSADLDLAVRGIVFSAAGTAGQRCTSLRRVIVHASIVDELVARVAAAYESLPIGSPLASGTLVGPLIDAAAYEGYAAGARQGAAPTAARSLAGGERVLADEARRRVLRPAGASCGCRRRSDIVAGRDVRADPVRA